MALDITLSVGVLPPPACFINPQQFAELLVAAMTATASGGVQWHAGSTPPSDLTMYWLVTDSDETGRPLDVAKYSSSDATWVRVLSTIVWCGDAGSTSINDLAVAPVPAFLTTASAYQYGRIYAFKCPNNTTGPVTLRVSGLAQKAVTKYGAAPLEDGDLVVGQIVLVLFDGIQFQILSAVVPSSTVAVANITPGTDRQTLRTGPGPVTQWESAFYGSQKAAPGAGANVSWAHGFVTTPTSFSVRFYCTAPDLGYAIGDEVDVLSTFGTSSNDQYLATVMANATDIFFVRNSQTGSGLQLAHKTTGSTAVAMDLSKWVCVAYAIR